MSNFPTNMDDDSTLPRIDDNITELGGDAINALRSATLSIETNIGLNAQGSAGSISDRLNVSLLPDGTINPSVLIGLLSLISITDAQVSATAAIQESKINLTHSTQSLYNLYVTLKTSIDILNGFLSLTGIKLEPHIDGTNYNHLLSAIHVDLTTPFVKTNPTTLPSTGTNVINRNTTNADTLVEDISNDLIIHEKSDGSANVSAASGGTVPPKNYAHMAGGVYVDPASFITIPQSNNSVQKVIDFIDNSSLLLLGGRVQNFYSNGIPNTSRSSSLLADGYGEPIVPPTPVTAYFLNVPPGPPAASPVDDFAHGDDVILFNPTSDQLNTFNFDAQFAQVSSGDLITIDYGTGIFYQFAVDSVKSLVSGSIRTYAVRINGKNPVADGYAFARIDRALFHRNKFGVLATCRAPNKINAYESLIITDPRAAVALGNGFNATEFDPTHYNLYLTLLSNGDLSNISNMPAIDVTGNKGTTPGAYTLNSIIDNINTAFRAPGFNYRFTAFEYQGQIGIALDPFNNAAFSIIGGVVDTNGNYTSTSNSSFPNNVVDGYNLIDPLGFGRTGANVASPPPALSYSSVHSAMFGSSLLFYPLKRNFFYTNGVERDQLNSDPLTLNNIEDSNGDGYWPATITTITTFTSRVEVVYTVNLDLSHSGLAAGKTIVIQPLTKNNSTINNVNYGRFIISNVSFTNCPGPNGFTNITVYDAVHAAGLSPSSTFPTGTLVNIYFCDDSVSFDAENVFDASSVNLPYKRFFEIYVDGIGHTTTHERARFSINPLVTSANIATIDIFDVSPKLRGYNTVGSDKEIRLLISSYDSTTGEFFAQLGRWNPASSMFTNLGPGIFGKKGLVTRLYDETNIDFIDFIFNSNSTTQSFTLQTIDIQLFSSLELDQQFMLLATCQVNDSLKSISYLIDKRQFGNVSEEQLSTSAKNYISASDKELHENGIIRGFNVASNTTNTVSFSGGTALVNGKLVDVNSQSITIPAIVESLPTVFGGLPSLTSTVNQITWFVCVNDKGEIELVASTDYNPIGPFIIQYLAASVDHLRLFYGLNLNAATPAPYLIRGTYFADLILNQHDLVPIATVFATVTNPGGGYAVTSMVIADVKRYVVNGYGGLADPLTLGAEASFRNLASVNNWLIQFNELISGKSSQANPISNKVIVKGHVNVSAPEIMGFRENMVYFEGDAGVFDVYVPTGFVISANVHFNNLTFNYFYDPTVVYDPFVYTLLTGTFNVSNGNNVVSTSISQVGTLFKGSIITFASQPGTLYNVVSVSSGSITLATNYNGTSNVATTCLFSGYSTSNYINSGQGLIYIGVGSTGRNIAVTNCKFIWNPTTAGTFPLFTASTSSEINRHSFINIELEQPTITVATILQDVNISKNTFIDLTLQTFSPTAQETTRAVVSFISKSIDPVNIFDMILINIIIRDNICDKDQMIVIAPTVSTTAGVVRNALNATGILIENNTCGVIAVFAEYGVPFDIGLTSTFSFLNFTLDKNNGIVIRNNTCKYITATDATGFDLVPILATSGGSQTSIPATGPMIVSDNTTSWIKLPLWGAAAPTVIKNNSLNAYDISFQKKFLPTAFIPLNAAIQIDAVAPSSGAFGPNVVLIDGNTINSGLYLTLSSPAFLSASYDVGIYVSQHDAEICNNIIANLAQVASVLSPVGIWLQTLGSNGVWLGSIHSNIHHNRLYRLTTAWSNYIFLGTAGTHTITDNFFDLPNPFGTYPANFEALIGGGYSTINRSSIHGNTNQVVYEAFSLADNLLAVRSTNSSIDGGQGTNGPANDAVILYSDGSDFIISRYTNYFSGAAGTIGSSSMYVSTFETVQATAGSRTMSFTVPLSNRLPPGVKILNLTLGAWLQLSGSATLDIGTAQNVLSLSLNVYKDNSIGNAGSLGIVDVKNNIIPNSANPATSAPPGTDNSVRIANGFSLLVGAAPSSGTNSLGPYNVVTQASITSATQYLVITPSVDIITGNNYRLAVQFDINYVANTTPTNSIINWYFSPLMVTYAWGWSF